MSDAVGVFGGAFDPPHAGHVLLAAYALSVAPVARVLVVPTFRHPFGKDMAPYDDRIAMCEAAFAPLAGVRVSRIEETLEGASYTVRTLEALHAAMPGASFRLLVGSDVLPETPRWREWDRVVSLAPPWVVGRSGSESIEDAPDLPAISSTLVRARYARGESVERLVPRSVDALVRARGHYGARPHP
ncbi:MAG: nicotinate (nicotinamide) nucleotide adenylyltransferase [Sandaracinus sp.]